MSAAGQQVALDQLKLQAFVGQAVSELGATLGAALVVIGDRLGLYKAMADAGPLSSAELAERTGTAERYVREWLNAQAAGGYVSCEGHWQAISPTRSLGSGTTVPPTDRAACSGQFARARAVGTFSGTELGFGFHSEPGVSSARGYAEPEHARNGAFL